MIFSESDHQEPFSGTDNSQLFSNRYFNSSSSSSLYNSQNNTFGSLSFSTISQSTIDVSSFKSRIHNLQMKLLEQNEISSMCNEKNNYFVSKITSDLTQSISNIRNNIDIVLHRSVLTEGRRISEYFKNTKNIIDSLCFNNETLEEKSNLADLARSVSLFDNNISDLLEASQNSFRKLKLDHQRITNQMSQSRSKLSSIESRHATIIQQSDEKNSLFDQIDEKTLSSFSYFVNNSSELIQSNSNFLAKNIRTESSIRESVNLILQKQANTINENVKANITRLTNDYKEIHTSFNKMIENTRTSISTSIEDTQSATDSMILEVNEAFNPLFEDIQKNFEILQNELVTTISSLSKNSNNALKEIEGVLEAEALARKKNYKIFYNKFNQFEKFIVEEKKIQKRKIKDMSSKINSLKSDVIDQKMTEPIDNVNDLSKTIESLDEIESQIDSIENNFNESLKLIQDDIKNYDLNVTEIYSSLEMNKNEISRKFDFIEQTINSLEPKRHDLKIEFRRFIENKSAEVSQIAQKRIEDANRKVEIISSFLENNKDSLNVEFKFDLETSESKNEDLTDAFKELEAEEEDKKSQNEEEQKKTEIEDEVKNDEIKDEVKNEENKDEEQNDEIKEEDKNDEIKEEDKNEETKNEEQNDEIKGEDKNDEIENEDKNDETKDEEQNDEIKDGDKNEDSKSSDTKENEKEEEDKNTEEETNEKVEAKKDDDNIIDSSKANDRNVLLDPIKSIGSAILSSLASNSSYILNESDFAVNFIDPLNK